MQDKAPGRGAVAQDKGHVLSTFGSCLPSPPSHLKPFSQDKATVLCCASCRGDTNL